MKWDKETIEKESNIELAKRLILMTKSGELPGRVIALKEAVCRLTGYEQLTPNFEEYDKEFDEWLRRVQKLLDYNGELSDLYEGLKRLDPHGSFDSGMSTEDFVFKKEFPKEDKMKIVVVDNEGDVIDKFEGPISSFFNKSGSFKKKYQEVIATAIDLKRYIRIEPI